MYTKAEILSALRECRAQLFRDLEVIRSLTDHYTSCYKNEADSQAIMEQRLRDQTVSTASAIVVLEASVANMEELDGKVAGIKETLLQMTAEGELKVFEGLWGKAMLTIGFSDRN